MPKKEAETFEEMIEYIAARWEPNLIGQSHRQVLEELKEQPLEAIRAMFFSARDEQERRRRARAYVKPDEPKPEG